MLKEVDKNLTDVWKRQFNYHVSDNEDACCFTCCHGRVVGSYILCERKGVDIPESTTIFKFEGVCDDFYSVYLPEDREVID